MFDGNLEGAGSLTVSGAGSTLNWYDGTLTGAGQLITANNATVSIDNGGVGKRDYVGRVLDRTWTNSGTVNWTATHGTTVTALGAITNEPGGTFDLQGSGGVGAYSTTAATFTNLGTIAGNLGTGSFSFGIPLADTAPSTSPAEHWRLAGGGTSSTATTVASGADLSVTGGSFSFTNGANVSGAGTFTSTAGQHRSLPPARRLPSARST